MYQQVLTFLKSQQEPRLLAHYTKDENLLTAYRNKKDLYATVASTVYNNNYEDNLEEYPDGSSNVDGTKRRKSCKDLLLGLMYGRGAQSVAEKLNITREEAEKFIKDFFDSYPKIKKWISKTEADAKVNGYVEDFYGRRRHLPDVQLPKYTIQNKNTVSTGNPLLECNGIVSDSNTMLINKYKDLLDNAKYQKEIQQIQDQALKEGVSIRNNGGFIAQAERQCVNSRIQGGAATMSKIAMIKVYHDKELNDLGFKLEIPVHDELIGECPVENAQKVADRLCEVMIHCVDDIVDCPMKCDPTIEDFWYQKVYYNNIRKEYKLLVTDMTTDEAIEKLVDNHSELSKEEVEEIVNG